MKSDDPRHGTERGYRTHLREKEAACLACRRAAVEANRLRKLEEPVELTGGEWVRRGLVLVWQPTPVQSAGYAKCGTDGGYYRHRRVNKDRPCEACRAAHAKAKRDRVARRREESAA